MSDTDPPRNATPAVPRLALGGWSYYFLAKLLLAWRGLIGLHALENLAFAALLAVPISDRRLRRLRLALAIPAAIALLYHDSFLPPFSRLWAQRGQVAGFGIDYLAELAGRFVNWQVIALLAVGYVLARIAGTWLRLGAVAVAGLLVMALLPGHDDAALSGTATSATAAGTVAGTGATATTPDQALAAFFDNESRRSVPFGQAGGTPFDVIFLHVCSMSWDDLRAVNLDRHPLLQKADIVFHHFNSAASYSGPAAIRLLRAPCGQPRHGALYQPAAAQCQLFPVLERAGFAQNLAMNHDGHFDDFLSLVRRQGVNAPLLPLAGLPVPQRGFDDSPIHDDGAALARWLAQRQRDLAPRTALYYNTISLHDGNRLVAGPDAGKGSTATYARRAAKLLDDLDGFIGALDKAGRTAVVVVVPEHGAALRGDRMQIAGLREFATPSVTTVPVIVKVVGSQASGGTVHVNDATSYTALSQLVAAMVARPPFDDGRFAPGDYTANLPVTRFVAENEGSLVQQLDQNYLLKVGGEPWQVYRP
ncbi:cellulose biosynthesis protein BcsG [Pseudoduganella lutea]|uniref:cellulose biosynthesis protein BcsG n=1 Tax=Pseudoduganella lutea TaxID=321985 RepID=UPI0013EE9375|nr:cellulose biosynthesis protein BcsG [Pseudoduganella lutea]